MYCVIQAASCCIVFMLTVAVIFQSIIFTLVLCLLFEYVGEFHGLLLDLCCYVVCIGFVMS